MMEEVEGKKVRGGGGGCRRSGQGGEGDEEVDGKRRMGVEE